MDDHEINVDIIKTYNIPVAEEDRKKTTQSDHALFG